MARRLDVVTKDADSIDGDLAGVTRLQVHRGLAGEADAAGCSRRENVPWVQGRER
jgi:hypothetical protein